MNNQKHHYEELLAEHYSWMFGKPFWACVIEQEDLLRKVGLDAVGRCLDLGCGSGFQSLALARMGASEVHSFDTSSHLLAELSEHAVGYPIAIHQADLTDFEGAVGGQFDTIVCMGDTLTHLESKGDVSRIIASTRARLAPNGHFVLSWRDMSSPLVGLDRFIPVRSTDNQIMLCFLEDLGETIAVHDLIFKKNSADWRISKSAYPKLKLSFEDIKSNIIECGLIINHELTLRGMQFISSQLLV